MLAEAARLVIASGQARDPGERWEYYNGNYFVAGAIVAALAGTSYERAMEELVVRAFGLTRTTFAAPRTHAPAGEGGRVIPASSYPRARRPSGGLWSTASDLLAVGEHLLARPSLLEAVRTVRTRPGDPMRYGYGWAVGPSGQMYLNGRLPGYRSAWLVVPEHELVAVALAAETGALPLLARVLSEVQRTLTGDELAGAIDGFAA